MKKVLTLTLLAMVSWMLTGTPAQGASSSGPGTTLVKHKKKHTKHKKHKA
jgi:hypothetical protein